MDEKYRVQLKIRRSPAECFAAVVDPARITGYFLGAASGPLVAGATVTWKFPEFDFLMDVVVREVVPHQRIVFEWPAADGGGYNTTVEMVFVALEDGGTMVQIAETGWRGGAASLPYSHGNCGGWMFFIAALKAYLEYGVNLREGGVV